MIFQRHDQSRRQEEHPEDPEVNLYVRLPDWKLTRQSPSPLAQLMGLHLYSEALLDKSARTEMNFAAIIILVVCLFEFLAWAFLFNGIFNSNVRGLGWGTIPAIVVAFLFASAIFWFERQFLTYDESQRGRNTKLAAVVRGCFIGLSVFITAQPLELMFFRVPIEKRIHQEGIREQAAAKLSAVEEENAREKGSSNTKAGFDQQAYDRYKEDSDKAATAVTSLREQLVVAEAEQAEASREAQGYRRQMQSAFDEQERRQAERAYFQADATRAAAARKILQLNVQISDLGKKGQDLQQQAQNTLDDLKKMENERLKKEAERGQRLRNWIEKLKASEPGEVVDEERKPPASADSRAPESPLWDKPWHYEDPAYDFFEQIKIVWDLARGKSPDWRNASPGSRKLLETEYGFAELEEGRHSWQLHLVMAIISCHLVALFIPLLVLCIKMFLMPPALRKYYSSRHQAEAGDLDAWNSLNVERRIALGTEDDSLPLRRPNA